MLDYLKGKIYNIIDKKKILIDANKYHIAKYLPEKSIILEAGAFDGNDTLQMATFWKDSTIHSFEPIDSLNSEIKKKIKKYSNVNLYKLGLSNHTGTSSFFISEGLSTASSSILKPKEHLNFHPDVKFEKSIQIEALTIDDWANKFNIHRIDLMWLDLQGAEPSILKASPKMLAKTKIIFTEVSLKEMYQDSMLYPEYRAWLEQQGFKVVWEDLPYADMGNVLFVRE